MLSSLGASLQFLSEKNTNTQGHQTKVFKGKKMMLECCFQQGRILFKGKNPARFHWISRLDDVDDGFWTR